MMVRRCSKKRRRAAEPAPAEAGGGDGGTPCRLAEVDHRMQGEGEQVEDDKEVGERSLSVSKIVFEVVSVGLQDVESLVLDLPAGAAAGGDFGDVVPVDREIGDEAVVIGPLSGGIADLDFKPVDQQSVPRFREGRLLLSRNGTWLIQR